MEDKRKRYIRINEQNRIEAADNLGALCVGDELWMKTTAGEQHYGRLDSIDSGDSMVTMGERGTIVHTWVVD